GLGALATRAVIVISREPDPVVAVIGVALDAPRATTRAGGALLLDEARVGGRGDKRDQAGRCGKRDKVFTAKHGGSPAFRSRNPQRIKGNAHSAYTQVSGQKCCVY